MSRRKKKVRQDIASKAVNILAFNLILFVVVKIILPFSGFELANLIKQILPFGSQGIVEAANEARIANGVVPLERHFALDVAAEEKLRDMIRNNYFAHTSPNGTDPWFWIEKNKYDYVAAGENLALGFSTAEDTVQGWLNSKLHRENLLNSRYRHIGVAVDRANLEGVNGVLVVQVFGAPMSFVNDQIPGSISNASRTRQPMAVNVETQTVREVNEPIKMVQASAKAVADSNVPEAFNAIYLGYLLGLTAIFSILALKFGFNKKLAFGIAGHVALLILVLTIPTFVPSLTALIF